jgi:predicted dehydrogenase
MVKIVNWGILGYAGIARKHMIPAFKNCKEAKLYAIASRSQEKLDDAVKTFGFVKTYTSYDALLEDSHVDAVYIPLPNQLHREWVIKAAQHNKHILCEKPLSLSAKDCEDMIQAAKDNDVFLMEAFMYRFTNRTAKLKEILDSGKIGCIKAIKSSHRFCMDSFDSDDIRLNKDLAGGAMYDVGCYPLNVIGMITGETPTKIKALKNSYRGIDTSLSAILKYPNGIIATLDCGFDSQSCLLTEVYGTKGCIVMRDTFLGTDAPILTIMDSCGELTRYEIPVSERYYDEANAVTRAILEGKKELLPFNETIRNNQLIADILAAAED